MTMSPARIDLYCDQGVQLLYIPTIITYQAGLKEDMYLDKSLQAPGT